jgi:PAS domain S-box-containing protein
LSKVIVHVASRWHDTLQSKFSMSKTSIPRAEGGPESAPPSEHDELALQERKLWFSALLLIAALAVTLAVLSWEDIPKFPTHLLALPVVLSVLASMFVVFASKRTKEIAELRKRIRGIEQRSSSEIKPAQLEQLFSLVERSQQGYRDLIDTFEDLLFSITLDGEIVAVNRSFADLLDKSFADIVGRRLDEFFDFPESEGPPLDGNRLARFLEHRQWSGILRVRTKHNNSIHYFDCVLHAIVRGNVVQGVSGLARDVTRQRESETRFTELFETLQEGVYLASPDDRITDVNPALVRMLGFTRKEDLIGVDLASLYWDPSDRAEERRKLNHLGFLRACEIALRHRKNDREVTVLHTTAGIHDPFGKLIRIQGALVDITERREMERRLHREEEFARRLMDSFPDLVVVVDGDTRYTFVSPHIKDVLGHAPEDLIGNKLGDLADPEDRLALRELFEDLLLGRREHGTIEFRNQHKNGGWRLIRASARPLHDENGAIVGVIASERDITERQHLQQQLIQSERLAAMGQMIAGVAHELNNPLTAILGVTELMRDQTTDKAAVRHLDLAHRQARRAAHIVESLLVFSRPTTPRNSLLHLSDLLQRTLQLHAHSLRSHHIHVDFVPRPDLPTVLGDPNQLTQVFLNLIVNAEQAIGEVRDHGTLRIRLGLVGERILVTFQDDGVGIRRETLPRIFDPFFTTKRPGRGTGLGLSICMAIVREHDGDISAQPLPDGGSVFTVSLPVCVKAPVLVDSLPVTPVRTTEPAASPAGLAGKRILVIDNEEGIRELVTESLSARGIAADCAESGDQALELAARKSYDLILCDLNLQSGLSQDMKGSELYDCFAERLAARYGRRPAIVYMIGDLVDSTLSEQLAQNGNRLLQKPFRISELVSLLTEVLSPAAPLEQ